MEMTTSASGPVPPVSRVQVQVQRKPLRPHTPSLWGHFFLQHVSCTASQLLSMKERAQTKKEEVRQIILETVASSNLVQKMELIDTLQRIGVGYHYKKEIHDFLCSVHEDKDGGSDNLYVTSLRFYLLRRNGYRVASDVFEKFKNTQGNISSDDVNCLLILYDAAHLRTHGEEILDNIITFNKRHLHSLLLENLELELREEILCTLETPRFRRVKRVEARRYISVYEKKATRDKTILDLAKLDYNILQAIYCDELKELTVWWKDFQSRIDLSFARDRMVELYLWMLEVVFEPYYSYSRIMMTKFYVLVSLFDDLYDNYTTTEESNIFTTALERWDEQFTKQLPAYLKALFINIMNTANDIEKELKLKKNKHADFFKKLVINTAKFYHAELKWRNEDFIPTNVEEHLQLSIPSSACMQMTSLGFISLGDVTTKEDVEWALTFPKIVRGACILGRVNNDIVSHEREQASEHVVSTVQACVKQYGITVEEAYGKLRAIAEEAWMDIIEECLEQKRPMALLEIAVNVARTMDFIYKREDAYTLSFTLKDVITSMFVNPV